MKIAVIFFLSALALTLSCSRSPSKEKEAAVNIEPHEQTNRVLFKNLSAEYSDIKEGINRRNLDAMNMEIALSLKTNRQSKLTRNEILRIIPVPVNEIYSGRSTISDEPDGSGGWWWNAKKKRLEVNPLK